MHVEPRPSALRSQWHEAGLVATVCLAQLLNQAIASQCLPMFNVLGESFPNVTNTDRVWFQASFPLSSGAFILISGKIGDLYGLKKVMLAGTIWSALWSLITGLAGYTDSVVFFCFARALVGIGIAFTLPNAVGVIGTLYHNGQRKALVFGIIGSMAPIGASMGTIFAGLTATFNHWQWAFYATTIILAVLGALTVVFIPPISRHAPPEAKMDWIGSAVGVCGLILFNTATNQAPEVGWNSPYVIVLLIIGFGCIVGFFFVEKRVKWPLLPQEIGNTQTILTLGAVAFGWASFSTFLFYYFLFMLNLRQWSPVDTGLTYLTFLVFGTIASISVGLFIRIVKPSILLFLATVAFLVGITMLSTAPVHQTYWQMTFPLQIILSFGMDLSFPASSLVLSDSLPKKHQGMAASLVSTMTNYSMSVALGFATTAQGKVYEHTGDLLKSYRAGCYVGIGFACVGCLLGIWLVVLAFLRPHHEEPEVEVEHYTPEEKEGHMA